MIDNENDTVKFERQESAVDEEGTVQEDPKNDEEGKDVIAPFSQWAEKKLEETRAELAKFKDMNRVATRQIKAL